MGNTPNNILTVLFIFFWLIMLAAVVIRLVRNFLSKEAETEATLENKESFQKTVYGKSHAPALKTEYVLTFRSSDNKKLSFFVSEGTYHICSKNQKGTLKYKGSRFISFED